MSSLGGWTSAMRDTSVDGIMCVSGKEHNECGRIQALQWASITVASIIVGLGGGYIADHFSYKFGYLCLIPIYLVISMIVLKYRTCVQNNEHKSKILDTIKSYKVLFTDKRFLWACLFLFLYKYSPSFGTPLAFIERDGFKWSGMWMGTLGAIVSGFEILEALIYFKIGKKINIKKWLIASVFLGATTTLCYLKFTPITAVVYGILFAILGMFVHLIIMAWMAQNTITGKEATSFALLCSISNLSATSSSLSGAFLYPKIGLQWLIILSAVTSFICLPLIRKLELTK
jgi:predicted MFS family arabinose efflux permease